MSISARRRCRFGMGSTLFAAAIITSRLGWAAPALARAADTTSAAQCTVLNSLAGPGLQISLAEPVAAGPLKAPKMPFPDRSLPDLPSHCLVRGVLNPRKGRDGKSYGLGFEMRLPVRWNGRFLFQGGGGLDGIVQPAIGGTAADGRPALARGFAVISSDGGHEGMDASFALDKQAKRDFAYAGLGPVAALGKRIIARYYGRRPSHSYFIGCSNGGREAMMAAERFPNAFDGIVAGDPGFNLSAAAIAEIWSLKHLLAIAPRDAKGQPILARALSPSDLALLAHSVLADCDRLDGLADGMINDAAACHYDPAVLACKVGQQTHCLGTRKIAAIEAVFRGPHDSSGRALYASWPYDAGIGTLGWRIWRLGTSQTAMPNAIDATLGLNAMRFYFLTPPQPNMTPQSFDFDRARAETRRTAAINDISGTLSRFAARGGKLIIYQGMSDPVFSPNAIIGWYRHLKSHTPHASSWARLFLVPGMNHCSGGPATDQFDALTAITRWTEAGAAPDEMVAHGKAFPGMQRPLCPYPDYARYKGGNADKANSVICKAP